MALTNDTLAARKALQAYLTVSADAGSVIEHRCLELGVQAGQLARPPRVVAPDHHPVRVQPVLHRGALPQELGIRDHRRVGPPQGGTTAPAEPTGTVDLVTTTAPGLRWGADLSRRLLDEPEIGRAVGALRRRDAEKTNSAPADASARIGREPQPPRLQPFGPESSGRLRGSATRHGSAGAPSPRRRRPPPPGGRGGPGRRPWSDRRSRRR